MNTLRLKAYAKINFGLDIICRRKDGYHNIRTIMQSIDLCDELTVTRSEQTVITCDMQGLDCGESNLVVRCIRAMEQYCGKKFDLRVHLEKHIPMQAGLGGGSADGAAALIACNRLYALDLSLRELMRVGASVGADIPFMLPGGTALCEGIGDEVHPLCLDLPHYGILIAKPQIAIDTREAYEAMDHCEPTVHPNFQQICKGLRTKDSVLLNKSMQNVFDSYAQTRYPEIPFTEKKAHGRRALAASMSGSGSACFGIFESIDDAERARAQMKGEPYRSFAVQLQKAGITRSN
jgi:4-diphosphocytidyl-2-C-methyl-D-erythritol kinase